MRNAYESVSAFLNCSPNGRVRGPDASSDHGIEPTPRCLHNSIISLSSSLYTSV